MALAMKATHNGPKPGSIPCPCRHPQEPQPWQRNKQGLTMCSAPLASSSNSSRQWMVQLLLSALLCLVPQQHRVVAQGIAWLQSRLQRHLEHFAGSSSKCRGHASSSSSCSL